MTHAAGYMYPADSTELKSENYTVDSGSFHRRVRHASTGLPTQREGACGERRFGYLGVSRAHSECKMNESKGPRVRNHLPVYILRGADGTVFECSNSLGTIQAAQDSVSGSSGPYVWVRYGQNMYPFGRRV